MLPGCKLPKTHFRLTGLEYLIINFTCKCVRIQRYFFSHFVGAAIEVSKFLSL